jgi:integrase
MASVYNRGTRAKPNWWVGWIDRSGQHRAQKVGPDRSLAVQVAAQVEADKVAKKFDVPTEAPPPVPLFDAAADGWIEMRSAIGKDGQPTVRSWKDNRTHLKQHLRPRFGRRSLDELTVDDVRKLIEELRPKKSAQTIKNVLHTLSRLYEDQPEALRLTNPVRRLKRGDWKRIGKGHDPHATPWLQSDDQVRRVYLAFPEMSRNAPWRAMFAVGVFVGLRPGEIRSLQWGDVDFAAGLIHVQRGDGGPTKNSKSRAVPLSPALASVLLEWKEACPPPPDTAAAPCFPCNGRHGRRVHKDSMLAALSKAFEEAELPRLTWYQATRHTYGGRFVTADGSTEKLRVILGHSSTSTTHRYGHLVRGQFSEAERTAVDVQLQPGKVLPLRGNRGA